MPLVHTPEQFLHVLRQHVLKHKDDEEIPRFKRLNSARDLTPVLFQCSTCKEAFEIVPTYDVSPQGALGSEQHTIARNLNVRAGQYIHMVELLNVRVGYNHQSMTVPGGLKVTTYVGRATQTIRAINLVPGIHVVTRKGRAITSVRWELGRKPLRVTEATEATEPAVPCELPTVYELLDG